jgi:DNA-binding GntR family transcriptional regulator
VSLEVAASGAGAMHAAAAIRALVQEGEFLPGQSLRQTELATRLGMSRVPIREALNLLLAEGLVRHEPHVGYAVARLNISELEQIYLMRRHLETELLRSIRPEQVTPEVIAELRAIHGEMVSLIDEPDAARFQALNRRFHYAQFAIAGLDLIEAEVHRLWQLSEPYRLVWASNSPNRRSVIHDHEQILAAIEARDISKLCAILDDHRRRLGTELGTLLRRSSPASPRSELAS